MFCPRCATENGVEQGYCRKCGQALIDVRLAVEGIPTKSLERLRGGAKWMDGGIATLILFTLIATIISILGVVLGHPTLSVIAMINALLGALIGVPLVLVGRSSMRRATRLLSATQQNQQALTPQRTDHLLPTDLRPEHIPVRAPGSVTENTTLNLRKGK